MVSYLPRNSRLLLSIFGMRDACSRRESRAGLRHVYEEKTPESNFPQIFRADFRSGRPGLHKHCSSMYAARGDYCRVGTVAGGATTANFLRRLVVSLWLVQSTPAQNRDERSHSDQTNHQSNRLSFCLVLSLRRIRSTHGGRKTRIRACVVAWTEALNPICCQSTHSIAPCMPRSLRRGGRRACVARVVVDSPT